ncbi:MAG TPA: DUF1295 domain-containing protein [Bacteroidia bacterium]|nr:DUF1295 domain-containing protein [Bacteroidia bacterium]
MNHLVLKMAGEALIAVCFVLFLVWLIQIKIKNAGIVDIFWSYNFPIIVLIYYFLGNGFEQRKMLIATMVIIWGARLGTYLLVRIFSHLHTEDGRYKQLRQDWAPNVNFRFLLFFQTQALSNVILSIPFLLICINPDPKINLLEYIGFALWLISIIGESVADRQLQLFKKNSDNKNKVCDKGLWNYSRHPNYFFEWMIWVSYFVFALSSPYGWISIICPLSMLFLLFKVTGIPMTEEQAIRSKGDAYKAYQRTTSSFIPLPKRN